MQATNQRQIAPTPRSGHTPGPWGIEWTNERAWIGPMRGYDGKIERIVSSTEREGLTAESLAEKDANARLIAAAPELKGELEKTTIFLETIVASVFKTLAPDSPQAVYLAGHIELNRAAIAKAEGAPSIGSGSDSSNASGSQKGEVRATP